MNEETRKYLQQERSAAEGGIAFEDFRTKPKKHALHAGYAYVFPGLGHEHFEAYATIAMALREAQERLEIETSRVGIFEAVYLDPAHYMPDSDELVYRINEIACDNYSFEDDPFELKGAADQALGTVLSLWANKYITTASYVLDSKVPVAVYELLHSGPGLIAIADKLDIELTEDWWR